MTVAIIFVDASQSYVDAPPVGPAATSLLKEERFELPAGTRYLAAVATSMGDIPTQVRVRTDPDDGYGHRYDAIQSAKDTFDVGNNTAAIVQACDFAGNVLPALEDALAEADIRPSEKEKIAEAVSTRQLSIDIEPAHVNVETE